MKDSLDLQRWADDLAIRLPAEDRLRLFAMRSRMMDLERRLARIKQAVELDG